MSAEIYYVPRYGNGKIATDYNCEIFAEGTEQESDWLTLDQYQAKFPAPAPVPPTPDELASQRRAEIIARFTQIDVDSIRPLRAIAQGEATEADKEKLAALDAEAEELRAELAALPVA